MTEDQVDRLIRVLSSLVESQTKIAEAHIFASVYNTAVEHNFAPLSIASDAVHYFNFKSKVS